MARETAGKESRERSIPSDTIAIVRFSRLRSTSRDSPRSRRGKFNLRAASRTLSAVRSLIAGWPLKTRLTVLIDASAASAIISRVIFMMSSL